MAHSSDGYNDLARALSLVFHENEYRFPIEVVTFLPMSEATLSALAEDEIAEYFAWSSPASLRRIPLKALVKTLRLRWIAQEGIKGLLGLQLIVKHVLTVAAGEELNQLAYLSKLLGNKLSDRLQIAQSELYKRCISLPTIIVPQSYIPIPVSEDVSMRFAALWTASGYFRPDALDDILLSGLESLLSLLVDGRERIEQTLRSITSELASLLGVTSEVECTALLSCLATVHAAVQSTRAQHDQLSRETKYLVVLLQLAVINGCMVGAEEAGRVVLVPHACWLVARLLHLAAAAATQEVTASIYATHKVHKDGQTIFLLELTQNMVRTTIAAMKEFSTADFLCSIICKVQSRRQRQEGKSQDKAVVHPGFYVQAMQALLGPREPLLRLYWQRAGFSNLCLFLPIVHVTAATRDAISMDLAQCKGKYGALKWRKVHDLRDFDRTFALLHSLRCWWRTDPQDVFVLIFEMCAHSVAAACKLAPRADDASTVGVIAACADLLYATARLFGLSEGEALSAVTLHAPYDWYLPVRRGIVRAENEMDVSSPVKTAMEFNAAESDVHARWQQEPLSMLRSVLYLRYLQSAVESDPLTKLAAWLQDSFRADARQTLLLVRDLCILLTECDTLRDVGTMVAVDVALRSVATVRVPNIPLTRMCLSAINTYAQHISSIPTMEAPSPSTQSSPPQASIEADQFPWDAAEELEKTTLIECQTESPFASVGAMISTYRAYDEPPPSKLLRMHALARIATRSPSSILSFPARDCLRSAEELYKVIFARESVDTTRGILLKFTSAESTWVDAAASGKRMRVLPVSAVSLNMAILQELGDALSSDQSPALPWCNFAACLHVLIHAAYMSLTVTPAPGQQGSGPHGDSKDDPVFATDPEILDVITQRPYLLLPTVLSAALRERFQQLLGCPKDEAGGEGSAGRFDAPYWVAKKYIAAILDIVLHSALPPRQLAEAVRDCFDPATVAAFWREIVRCPTEVIRATADVLQRLAESLIERARPDVASSDAFRSTLAQTVPFWAIVAAVGWYGAKNVTLSVRCQQICAALQASARFFAPVLLVAVTATSAEAENPMNTLSAFTGQEYWIDVKVDQSTVRRTVWYLPDQDNTGNIKPVNFVTKKYDESNNQVKTRACVIGMTMRSLAAMLIHPPSRYQDERSEPSAKEVSALIEVVNHGVAQVQAGEWSDAQIFLAQYFGLQRGTTDNDSWNVELLDALFTAQVSTLATDLGKSSASTCGIQLAVAVLHQIASDRAMESAGRNDNVEEPGGQQERAFNVLARHLKLMTANTSLTAQNVHNQVAWMLDVLAHVRPQLLVTSQRRNGSSHASAEQNQADPASIESDLAAVARVIKVAHRLRVNVPQPVRRRIMSALAVCLHYLINYRGDDGSTRATQNSVHLILRYLPESNDRADTSSVASQVQSACFELLPGVAADIGLQVQKLTQADDTLREIEREMCRKRAAEKQQQAQVRAAQVGQEHTRARTNGTVASTPPATSMNNVTSTKRAHKASTSSHPVAGDEANIPGSGAAKRQRPSDHNRSEPTPLVAVKEEREPHRTETGTPDNRATGRECTPQGSFPATADVQRTPTNGATAAAARGVPSVSRKFAGSPVHSTQLSVSTPEAALPVTSPAMVPVKSENKPAERAGLDIPVAASTPANRPRMSATGKPASAVSKKFSDFGM